MPGRHIFKHEGQLVLHWLIEEIDIIIILPRNSGIRMLNRIIAAVDQIVSFQLPTQLVLRLQVGNDQFRSNLEVFFTCDRTFSQ